ncbi:beta-1,4-N-acetylgalactosaminyltransferase bre-4-like [Macrosteles quadrilineatus]|uniref:beta-1,4-N-acetylgalactosaminyltransferase bre-4-like n=1 Tax=Macrosteles quadrilineatus TaxID=74068 RepID=UPI0023E0C082|nr:beta-1,4-N-acetylgalactosaminyltransferase bre-4-like [Macrosteles quadrilineatus]
MSARLSINRVLTKRLLCNFKGRILLLLLSFAVFILVYQYIISLSQAKIISLDEIPDNLVPAVSSMKDISDNTKLCDLMPIVINSSWPLSSLNVTDEYLETLAIQSNIKLGGLWKPSTCVSQHKVAIVVPYRDRQSQLDIFVAHMHPFLQFQHLHYQIIIVEQTHQRPFNRAKLFNIGFVEAEKISPFHCYIFHDVDLIPLNIHNIYGCTKLPRHLSANIDVFDYKIPYDWIFGGAVAILKQQFVSVNGFSNKFFGWGGEDDDFFNRVTRNGTTICRFEPEISRYTMLTHKKELPNEDRYYYLSTGVRRFESDGLNSLKYTVRDIELKPLYTKLLVDL